MMTLGIFSLLFGMAMGQRFKVLVLLPGIAVALVVAVGAGIAQAETAGPIALLAAASIASLQIGYLAGIILRYAPTAFRASRLRAGIMAGSMPTRRPAH
jgi:hypothetical protein